MAIVFIIIILTFLFLVRLRIRKVRPHWVGNILFLALSFFTALTLVPVPVVLPFTIFSTVITHILAKKYDKSPPPVRVKKPKRSKKTKSASSVQPPNPSQEPPETSHKPPEAPKEQPKPSAPVEPQQPADPPKTAKKPVQPQKAWKKPDSSAPKQPRVQQTLTSCVCCGQPLKGSTCRHCGFDHIAQPIYLLCLISPRQLQINTDPDTEET